MEPSPFVTQVTPKGHQFSTPKPPKNCWQIQEHLFKEKCPFLGDLLWNNCSPIPTPLPSSPVAGLMFSPCFKFVSRPLHSLNQQLSTNLLWMFSYLLCTAGQELNLTLDFILCPAQTWDRTLAHHPLMHQVMLIESFGKV